MHLNSVPLPPSKLVGKWELADSKNWNEFLDENGELTIFVHCISFAFIMINC